MSSLNLKNTPRSKTLLLERQQENLERHGRESENTSSRIDKILDEGDQCEFCWFSWRLFYPKRPQHLLIALLNLGKLSSNL